MCQKYPDWKKRVVRPDSKGSRRRCQNRKHKEPSGPGISDAVRNAFGRNHQLTRAHGDVTALEKKDPITFQYVVKLVHSLMGMNFVHLPCLEGVQPHE